MEPKHSVIKGLYCSNPFHSGYQYSGYFGKQWKSRWNAEYVGISSGSALFAKIGTIFRDRNTSFYRIFNWLPFKIQPICMG